MARPFYTGLNNINLLLRYCKNYKIKLKSYDNKINCKKLWQKIMAKMLMKFPTIVSIF